MEFTIPPEHQAVLDVADKVAAQLAPGYVERDLAGEFAWDVAKILGDAGLLGLDVPEEAGGQGAGALIAGLAIERLSSADSVAATLMIQAASAAKLLHTQAQDRALVDEWVPRLLAGTAAVSLAFTEGQSGSDLKNITTRARRTDAGDWVVNGEKQSISVRGSQAVMLLADSPEGPVLLFVPTDSEGFTRTPTPSLGRTSSGRATLFLDDVVVPRDNVIGEVGGGLRKALASLSTSRLHVSMGLIGLGRGALEETVRWVKERETFGKVLAERQGIAFPLVDHWTELEMCRLLCLQGLWKSEVGEEYKVDSAMVKARVPESMSRLVHDCLITFGHTGYTLEHPVQLRLRDILGAELGEGPANIQKILLSRYLLGSNPG